MEKILETMRQLVIGSAEDESFDQELVIHINSILSGLHQLGVGLPLVITTEDSKWTDFLNERTDLEMIKSYMYLKLRLLFDPPSTSFVLESIQRQITEYEWRINDIAERGATSG